MRNFDTELDTAGVTRMVTTSSEVKITQQVTVTHQPSTARGFVAKTDTAWDWSDLRDYVVAQIESRTGVFPRDFKKEAAIFKGFMSRHPEDAVAIARYAFETSDGYWAGAPISVNRFCKGSDPFFADKISARLVDSPVSGW